MRGSGAVVLTGVLLSTLAGCGSLAAREDAAAAAAARFTASLRTSDPERGCAALAPGTRDELEQSAEQPCARALPEAGLPAAGPVRTVDVYGGQARVVAERDTLFLSSFPGGWKVTAAGCVPRAERPYRCLVKGG
ncbi:hypothetical protein [Streptomyces sp. NRRL B-1347]|uniref:hypothetical protein n=1 Tax=Streptomyces sp. NRRL B-1347 TaxID=1476877 RepID=UPI0004CA5423|nr:hypothetical protein [Streptomyces sp. NRRL B-1347]